MTVDARTNESQKSPMGYARLNDEVRRLLDFKKNNVKGRNRTPCPECAMAVDVHANKCPHCSSEIAVYTENVRRNLAELDDVTQEIHQLHTRFMEYRAEEAAMQPLVERLRRMFSGPDLIAGLKTVLPAFLLFFAFLAALRIIGNGLLFWAGLVGGGLVAFSLLKKTSVKHYVTVELYQAVLVIGLIMMMSGATTIPIYDWSVLSSDRVEVIRPVANIRESATTESRIVATVNQGDELTVVERRGTWYHVKTRDGRTGWVYANLVKG
jgi:hypothetical protein